MIIGNFLLFIFSFLIISASLIGYGKIINYNDKYNDLENIFFGFLVLAFLNTLFHFFIKLSLIYNFLILLFGLILYLKNSFNIKSIKEKNFLFFLLILFTLVPIFISQKYHEDFGYYHLPYASLLFNEKIIFGIANTNIAYVYNSIWLNIYSSFFIFNNNFNFLTLSTFILYVVFISYLINLFFKDKNWKLSKLFLSLLVFYFVLKFTRISEYGLDLPTTIYANISILYFIKFFETDDLIKKKSFFYLNFVFAIFAILIKFSIIPILFLTIIMFLSNFDHLKKEIFLKKYLFIISLFSLFVIQQFIYTGCIVFPSEFSCMNVSWFNEEFLTLKDKLELINKSYDQAKLLISKEEFLNNFNWFKFWISRNYVEILEHLFTMFLPFSIIYLFLRKEKNKIYKIYEINYYLFIFVIIGTIFWLSFSPVYRFGISYFLVLVFLIFSVFFKSKFITEKLFIIILCICFSFSIYKNVNRFLKKGDIFFGVEKIENKYILDEVNSKNNLKIYFVDITKNNNNGWQGRLCWDVPIICTHKKVKTYKKNSYIFINKISEK